MTDTTPISRCDRCHIALVQVELGWAYCPKIQKFERDNVRITLKSKKDIEGPSYHATKLWHLLREANPVNGLNYWAKENEYTWIIFRDNGDQGTFGSNNFKYTTNWKGPPLPEHSYEYQHKNIEDGTFHTVENEEIYIEYGRRTFDCCAHCNQDKVRDLYVSGGEVVNRMQRHLVREGVMDPALFDIVDHKKVIDKCDFENEKKLFITDHRLTRPWPTTDKSKEEIDDMKDIYFLAYFCESRDNNARIIR